MAIPQVAKEFAYARCRGGCECKRAGHGHIGRCHKTVTKAAAGYLLVDGEHTTAADKLPECLVLCRDCLTRTPSYWRHS